MNDSDFDALRQLAVAFRAAIEAARAERASGALPYFPDGACRTTSRLLALHLAHRPGAAIFGRPQLVSGVLPGTQTGRHYWLELNDAVVDLTADPFGEAAVVVGSRTAFHRSLTLPLAEDAGEVLDSLSPAEITRLKGQLATIESRLSGFAAPAA